MNRFELLWKGYQSGSLTEAEVKEFINLLDTHEQEFAFNVDQLLSEGKEGLSLSNEKDLIFDHVQRRIKLPVISKHRHRVHFLKTAWFRYAAAVFLLIIGISVLLYFSCLSIEKRDGYCQAISFTSRCDAWFR